MSRITSHEATDCFEEYLNNPINKGNYIRAKLLKSKLFNGQPINEDPLPDRFKIEKLIDNKINTHKEFFRENQLEEEEAKFVIRIFKRLVYLSIKSQFGYLKRAINQIGIRHNILCKELQLSTQVL